LEASQQGKIVGKDIFVLTIMPLAFVIWLIDHLITSQHDNRVSTPLLSRQLNEIANFLRAGFSLECSIQQVFSQDIAKCWSEQFQPFSVFGLREMVDFEELSYLASIIKREGEGKDAGKGRVCRAKLVRTLCTGMVRDSSGRAA
jgi:hypothetical protein